MESVEGRKMLTAKDAQGRVLYNGPIDTEEERAKLPANLRQGLETPERQGLPKVPAGPEPPEAPRAPEPQESARLQQLRAERAALAPNHRTGWVRSTFIL